MDRLSRTEKRVAISSKTQDGNHILFWDFDNIRYYDVLKSLGKTQSYNGLGMIYIIDSEHGYNAFCLDKFFIEHAYNIKYFTRFADFSHTDIGYKNNSWCLRLSKTKKLIDTLLPTDSHVNREQSNAHLLFFNKFFGISLQTCGYFDSLKEVQIESYKQDVI